MTKSLFDLLGVRGHDHYIVSLIKVPFRLSCWQLVQITESLPYRPLTSVPWSRIIRTLQQWYVSKASNCRFLISNLKRRLFNSTSVWSKHACKQPSGSFTKEDSIIPEIVWCWLAVYMYQNTWSIMNFCTLR